MTQLEIINKAREAGFVIIVSTEESVAIRKARNPIITVDVDKCTESILSMILTGKKPKKETTKKAKPKAKKSVEKEVPAPVKKEAPIENQEAFQNELESINGIGKKTALMLVGEYSKVKLLNALKNSEDIKGVSKSIEFKLAKYFEV